MQAAVVWQWLLVRVIVYSVILLHSFSQILFQDFPPELFFVVCMKLVKADVTAAHVKVCVLDSF